MNTQACPKFIESVQRIFFFSEGVTTEAVLSSYVHSGSWDAIVSGFMQKYEYNCIVFWPCIGAVFFVMIAVLMKISFCECGSCHIGNVKLEENP